MGSAGCDAGAAQAKTAGVKGLYFWQKGISGAEDNWPKDGDAGMDTLVKIAVAGACLYVTYCGLLFLDEWWWGCVCPCCQTPCRSADPDGGCAIL